MSSILLKGHQGAMLSKATHRLGFLTGNRDSPANDQVVSDAPIRTFPANDAAAKHAKEGPCSALGGVEEIDSVPCGRRHRGKDEQDHT